MVYVKTTITIPKEQSKFLRENGYSPSRLFQNHVSKLMKLSEGQVSQPEPTEEPHDRSSNV